MTRLGTRAKRKTLLNTRSAGKEDSWRCGQAGKLGWITISLVAVAVFGTDDASGQIPQGYFTDVTRLADPAGSRFPNVNQGSVEAAPTMPADGQTLLFTSDRGGGYGDFDLYEATRSTPDAAFGEVMNLGPDVNTAFRDVKPVVSPDGLSLYFSSNQPGGLGGFDIYQATRPSRDAPFGNVTNLETINTAYTDSPGYVSPDGRSFYFSSNRPGGTGAFDFYVATREDPSKPFGDVTALGVNSPSNEFSLSFSSDGLTVFFGEYYEPPFRPEGHGGSDIWMATRESTDEPFQSAVNLDSTLGSEILFGGVNSSGNDRNPVVSPDWPAPNSKMYFERFINNQGDIYEATWVPVPLLGDFDASGTVDQGDLDLVLLNWGGRTHPSVFPDTWTGAPAAGPTIDQQELDSVLLEWGRTAAGGGAPVPEPATSVLLLASLAVLAVGPARSFH